MPLKNPVIPKKSKRSEKEKTSTFFQNIRDRRLELGLTQSELAARMGLPQARISGMENGTFAESPERIELLARALETTPDYLFGFREEP